MVKFNDSYLDRVLDDKIKEDKEILMISLSSFFIILSSIQYQQ